MQFDLAPLRGEIGAMRNQPPPALQFVRLCHNMSFIIGPHWDMQSISGMIFYITFGALMSSCALCCLTTRAHTHTHTHTLIAKFIIYVRFGALTFANCLNIATEGHTNQNQTYKNMYVLFMWFCLMASNLSYLSWLLFPFRYSGVHAFVFHSL